MYKKLKFLNRFAISTLQSDNMSLLHLQLPMRCPQVAKNQLIIIVD